MSCCPPAPEITATEVAADEPSAGPEEERLPGEPEACYSRRTGNVSETGRVDDKTEEVPDKIRQTSIVTNCSAQVNMTFSMMLNSQPITNWVMEPTGFILEPSAPAGISDPVGADAGSGLLRGTFDQGTHGKKLTLRVKAYNGVTLVDDRTYTFSPALCNSNSSIRLQHPLPGSLVTSTFGPRKPPAQGASSSHKGADFAYPNRVTKDVFCAADGVVTLARPGQGYGNYVMVKHTNPNGNHICTTLYAHLDRIYVAVGQKVGMGQAIGKEGSTGIGSGPHLHFEVQLPNGTRVDPLPYLKGTTDVAETITPDNQPSSITNIIPVVGGNSITPENNAALEGCPAFGPSYGDPPTTPPATPPTTTPDPGEYQPTDPFEIAWLFVSRHEVNALWATTADRSPTMINPGGNVNIDNGLIDSAANRQRTGWIDNPSDPGGKTKFGVSQRANPQVKVETASYEAARSTAYNKYWLAPQMNCSALPLPVACFMFDCNYLFGPGGAKRIYDAANITGATAADIDKLYEARLNYLATRSASLLAKFGRGWTRRTIEARDYAKAQI